MLTAHFAPSTAAYSKLSIFRHLMEKTCPFVRREHSDTTGWGMVIVALAVFAPSVSLHFVSVKCNESCSLCFRLLGYLCFVFFFLFWAFFQYPWQHLPNFFSFFSTATDFTICSISTSLLTLILLWPYVFMGGQTLLVGSFQSYCGSYSAFFFYFENVGLLFC